MTIADRDDDALGVAKAALAAKGYVVTTTILDVAASEGAAAAADALVAREGRI